jgi:NitT/TauT family transport system ATP-binding protein
MAVIASDRPLVSMKGVSKKFANGTLALRGLDLSIQEHDFVSLLGPSGCGKSTALKLVAGLSDVSTGTIEWPRSTYDAHGNPEREVAFVFQEPTLMPWATVFDNIYLPLRMQGVSRNAARPEIEAAIERVGLGGFANSYPRELSGGMKMRVSIARGVINKPRLMLMDEPFAALDEITRFKLNNDLINLWLANKWTVIFVTHSVFESVYLSRRIIVMAARPGRIVGEVEIDAPYPRTDAFRTTSLYADYCREVSAMLAHAMEQAA